MLAARRGETACPVRQRLSLGTHGGLFLAMCATDLKHVVCKSVTVHPANTSSPVVQATVEVIDAATGLRLLRLHGSVLTARRTAALSSVAVRHCFLNASLPKRREEVKVLVFGSGEQAKAHVAALSDLFSAETIAVRVKMAVRMRKDLDGWESYVGAVTPADVAEADVIVSATSSPVPLVTEDVASRIRADAIVCAIGSFQSITSEWPPEFVRRCSVVVDQREACAAEAGDLICAGWNALSSDVAELSEVTATGSTWHSQQQRTVFFKSVGTALWDLAAGNCAVEEASRSQI